MISQIRFVPIVVVLILAGLGPALGVTIEPGVYRMEWRVPASDDVPFSGRNGVGLGPISDSQIDRFRGLCSAKSFVGSTDHYTVILDESNGTGSGYDTAYVFENVPDESDYDLGAAARIKLKKDGQALVPEKPDGVVIDRTIGREGSQITKKAALSVSFRMTVGEHESPEPEHAWLTLRGGWYGKIRTDAGELDVQVLDINSNGVYDDTLAVNWERPMVRPGDMMLLGGTPKTFEEYQNLVYIAETSCYDDKLYSFDVSATGDTVTIEPYTGDMGTINVKAIDGYSRPTQCTGAAFYGEAGMFFRNGTRVTVPPGDYRCMMAMIMPEQSGPREKRFGVTVRPEAVVKVVKDKEALVKVGGPMKVEIEPESRTITAKAGQQKLVRLVFTVGGAELGGVEGNRRAWVNIRDSRGKLLSSEQTGFG